MKTTFNGTPPWVMPARLTPSAPTRAHLIVRATDALYRLDATERRSLAAAVLAESRR
jgi:hypothetical protein